MNQFYRRAAACALVLVGTLPALAQSAPDAPVTVDNKNLELSAIGHDLTLPLPNWLTDAERLKGDIKPLVEMTYYADPDQALLEMYPKGESDKNWTKLYGARISLQPGRPLTDYRNATMYGYSKTCKPEAAGFFQFSKDEGDNIATLGYVCGAYLDNIPGYAGQGEVMIMEFRKTPKGVAIVYQEWRGPKFDPSTPATWPVPTDEVEKQAALFKSDVVLAAD